MLMMLDVNEAAQIAVRYLSERLNLPADDEVVITETAEDGDWWLFMYNSRMYMQTGDLRYAIVEGHPVAVRKQDGSVMQG